MQKAMVINVESLKSETHKVLEDLSTSKSSKMKALFELGLEVKEIAGLMGVRYNFAYNVVSNYVNMNGIQVKTSEKSGKKEQIIEMFQAGKSNKEISIELQTNYNYVHNVLKQHKATLPATPVTPEQPAEEAKPALIIDLTKINIEPDTQPAPGQDQKTTRTSRKKVDKEAQA